MIISCHCLSLDSEAAVEIIIICPYHSLTGLLAIHEALGDGVRSEDLIPGQRAEKEVSDLLKNYFSPSLKYLSTSDNYVYLLMEIMCFYFIKSMLFYTTLASVTSV